MGRQTDGHSNCDSLIFTLKIGRKFPLLNFMSAYGNHSNTVRKAECSRQWRTGISCWFEPPWKGVPHGSVSGLILFALHVNDMPNATTLVTNDFVIRMYF